MLMLYSVSSAQCLVYAEEELAKHCHGTQLTCQELNNGVRDASLMLKRGTVYTLYLLNPSHHDIQYSLINDFHKQGDFLHIKNNAEDYQKYVIPAGKSMEHKISLILNNEMKTCVLLAVYMQDSLPDKPAGIYSSFEEFKKSTPGPGYITTFSEEKEQGITYYSMSDKEERKKYKKIYGFCDGADIYLNVATLYPAFGRGNRFARVEKIGRYYYLETTRIILVANVPSPWVVQLIVDSGTGETTELTNSSLKRIISNDQDLLTEFESEKHKQKELKEYLKRYSERKIK